jgi:hypothetical protein
MIVPFSPLTRSIVTTSKLTGKTSTVAEKFEPPRQSQPA